MLEVLEVEVEVHEVLLPGKALMIVLVLVTHWLVLMIVLVLAPRHAQVLVSQSPAGQRLLVVLEVVLEVESFEGAEVLPDALVLSVRLDQIVCLDRTDPIGAGACL